jgi:hypothetical protein
MPRFLLTVVLLAISACAPAQTSGLVVEGVQSPAWVERAGRREPLSVGMSLSDKDRVISGRNARVLLRMPEGSFVKLGADGRLDLDRLTVRAEPDNALVTAALNVVKGAFRFTTQAARRFQGRREVDVRIATITVGIRGTDLWGKAADDRDIVCLIEGRISVQRETEPAFAMDQPLSFYIAPKNAPPLPVAPVPQEQLDAWSAETEIQPRSGATRADGDWLVYATDVVYEPQARALHAALREAGFPAELHPVELRGSVFYRVRIRHLPSFDEANALVERLRTFPGVTPSAVRG